jgi:hypothetical protein
MPFTQRPSRSCLKYLIPALLVVLLVPTSVAFASTAVAKFVYELVVNLFGAFMSLGGFILDWSINTFVIKFGTNFGDTNLGSVVDSTWKFFRDIFNLTFIFGLIFLGFKMILGTDDSQTRRTLVTIILAALLVNFSLFITKFVVDFSNILAVSILNQGVNQEITLANGGTVELIQNEGDYITLSETMITLSKSVTSIDHTDAPDAASVGVNWGLIFGTMLLFIVSTFVFAATGILLIIRAAVLLILMIVSPFLFLGWVLPMFKGLSNKLWRMLFSRAFMAPIYVAIMYIGFLLMGGFLGSVKVDSFSKALGSAPEPQSAGATFGVFILLTVLMVMSLVAAQRLGAEGANATMKIGNRLQRYGRRQLGNTTFGGAAYAGRKVGGGLANKAAQNKTLRRLATSDSKYGKYIARPAGQAALRTADKVASASFDARNVAGLGAATGLGTGKKGGFKADVKAKTKKEQEMMDLIGAKDPTEAEAEAFKKENLTKAEQFQAMASDSVTMGTVASEIKSLENSIEANENQLTLGKDDTGKVLTPQEVAEKQALVETQKQQLEVTKMVQSERQAIEKLTKSVDDLDKKEAAASTPEEAAQFRAQKQAAQQELSARKENLDAGAASYVNKAENAKNELKYKDQLGYMKSLEDSAKMKQGIADLLSGKAAYDALFKGGSGTKAGVNIGTVAGTSGVAATPWVGAGATAGAGATLGAGAVISGAAYQDRQVIEELKKNMGSNAREMAIKDKQNKSRKDLGKAFEEWQKENSNQSSSPTDSSASSSTDTDENKTT